MKTASSQSLTKYPKNELPTNHKADASPSLQPPSASAEASPVVQYHPPIPEQVLKAPDAVPPILYEQPKSEQDQTNGNTQIPQVTPGIVSQIPISVVGEKKYKLIGGFVPLLPSQVLLSPPTGTQQNPAPLYLTTVPSQDPANPAASLKYPEEYVTQKKQDHLQLPKQVSPAKITKSPNHLYPKKWRPEKEKENIKKKNPKTDVGNLSSLETEYGSNQQKKEWKQTKEHQNIPTALEAASSYQKADLTLFPVQGKPKVPGIDEQVETKL